MVVSVPGAHRAKAIGFGAPLVGGRLDAGCIMKRPPGRGCFIGAVSSVVVMMLGMHHEKATGSRLLGCRQDTTRYKAASRASQMLPPGWGGVLEDLEPDSPKEMSTRSVDPSL